MRSFIASAVLFALAASALPAPLKFAGCDISKLSPDFPAGETALVVPAGQTPRFVARGTGVQNYTCTSAGTYTSAGAVAQLFDASCSIQKLGPSGAKLGDHYFVTAPSGTGISPKFDFTAALRDSSAFVLAAKSGSIASPQGSANVDWLQLGNVQGSLAKTVYRVDTVAGQPPASCTPGSALISVAYQANYWFYN